jgi:flagellar protein FlbD
MCSLVPRFTYKEETMISLTRLNDSALVVNSELIEFIEAMPDTIITLTTGQKILVKETVEEVVHMVKEYKREIYQYPIVKE